MRPVRVIVPATPGFVVVPLEIRGITQLGTWAIDQVSGAISITLEYTLDDVYSPTFNPATASWYAVATNGAIVAAASGPIADQAGGFIANPTALRATNAGVGTARMTIIQPSTLGA